FFMDVAAGLCEDKLQLTGISKAATYTLLIDSVKVEVNNADAAA
ncbi:hypothetical protein WG7_01099, partial [Escherichia coli KTE38]